MAWIVRLAEAGAMGPGVDIMEIGRPGDLWVFTRHHSCFARSSMADALTFAMRVSALSSGAAAHDR